jgi:hypothetical protein
MRPQVRFCKSSDGVQLAYATSGEGPPPVRAPRHTVLRFAQRGTGPELVFAAYAPAGPTAVGFGFASTATSAP